MIDFNLKEQEMITKEDLQELAETQNTHCVSIFIPTQRSGKDTLEGKDALNLKNQLKETKSKLEQKGMSVNDIDSFTRPIQELIDNGEFWRHQSDGLAIFLSEKEFRKYTMPVSFEAFNYLSHEFYLKPLIPLFHGDGTFYLLTLKKDEVKLYEGKSHSILEVKIDDLVPASLEDSVGHDYEQKGIQFRTQQGNQGAGSFHGQEDIDSSEKAELVQYFRAIDKGLMSMLHDDQNPPLVVCCLDSYFPIYQKVNSHKSLFPQNISGNPADMDAPLLHEHAWELLHPHFDKTRQEKLEKFAELLGTGKASDKIDDVFPAAFEGRVDTLFLENNADIFGIYNPSSREVKLQEAHHSTSVSLMNLLAKMVLKAGGAVYLQDKENMPAKPSKVNALFRY